MREGLFLASREYKFGHSYRRFGDLMKAMCQISPFKQWSRYIKIWHGFYVLDESRWLWYENEYNFPHFHWAFLYIPGILLNRSSKHVTYFLKFQTYCAVTLVANADTLQSTILTYPWIWKPRDYLWPLAHGLLLCQQTPRTDKGHLFTGRHSRLAVWHSRFRSALFVMCLGNIYFC